MMVGRSICSSDDNLVFFPKKPSLSRLTLRFTNWNIFILLAISYCGLRIAKEFRGKKQEGKWLTPGGNTRQFKSSNKNAIINWHD